MPHTRDSKDKGSCFSGEEAQEHFVKENKGASHDKRETYSCNHAEAKYLIATIKFSCSIVLSGKSHRSLSKSIDDKVGVRFVIECSGRPCGSIGSEAIDGTLYDYVG